MHRRSNAVRVFPRAATPSVPVVTDASVIINLNATASATAIIGAFPNPFLVTASVRRELPMGESRGHRCGERLEALIGQGLLELAEPGPGDDQVIRSLVEGGFEGTLDDGEAATIACAVRLDGLALIDERKARRICAARFPDLLLASTVEMLLHPLVAERLGESGQSDAIFLALRDARMQVPRHRLKEVIERIGADRTAECPSLPRALRDTRTRQPLRSTD